MPPKAQPADLTTPVAFQSQADGSIWLEGGNIYSDGNGNLSVGSINPSMPTTAPQVIATNGQIAIPASTGIVRVAPAAAVTGVTLPNGLRNGQELVIINTSVAASSVTFTGANIAQAYVLAGVSKLVLYWDSVANIWY